MTTYLGKSCSFGLPRVFFVNCRQFMYLVISLLVLRAGCGIWLYQFLIIAYLFTLIPLWFVHENSHLKQRENGKSSQIFCFKLLKDGTLLCEALIQNCSDLSHIFAESRINRILFRKRTERLYIHFKRNSIYRSLPCWMQKYPILILYRLPR